MKNVKKSVTDDKNHDDESSDDELYLGLKPGDIIQGRFYISCKIGQGSFGSVYKVLDQKQDNTPYAMKVEQEADESSMLEREIKVLIEMRKKLGFPQIKFYGQEKGFTYCIMTLLGKNMDLLAKKVGGHFSAGTILRVGIQRLELLHEQRYIHRDIKPDNFVLEVGYNAKIVNLIDFGLSKHYISAKGEHIPQARKAGLIGTARYASLAAHEEIEQGRKDDLESVGYVLIYLATGSLPWMNLQLNTRLEKYAKIYQMKKQLKLETLCKGVSKCFLHYMNDVRNMPFNAAPNYTKLKQYFQEEIDILTKQSTSPFQFDWELLPEYQGKKKHMTVHVMQTHHQHQLQDSPPKKEEENHQTFEQLMDRQDEPPKKKGTKKTIYSPTGGKSKKCIMINVLEPLPGLLTPPNKQNYQNTLLQIPSYNSFLVNDSYAPSTATSKINNYQQSDEVLSEGGLPIWEERLGFQVEKSGIMRGIRKPSMVIQRRERKAHTQIDTIKIISKTFIHPRSILGDEEIAMEGLE